MSLQKCKKYFMEEIPWIQLYGRNICGQNGCTFFWTGSGFEISVDGGELWIDAKVPKEVLPPWICVYLNGTLMSRFQLPCGTNSICLFSGLHTGYEKRIRIRKESPASFDGQDCFFVIQSVHTNGSFLEFEKPDLKIEALGDSITAGEGLGGGQKDLEWEACLSSSRPDFHYAEQVAERLHADLRIIAEGGWGVLSSYDNNPKHTIPYIYPYLCGAADQEAAMEAGAWKKYRDDTWRPDIVLINLGTNDAAAFVNPPWTDPETGITYKQHTALDGTFAEEDLKKFEKAVYEFLEVIRIKNPGAYIIWIYGMLHKELEPQIVSAIEQFRTDHPGEQKIAYLSAKDTSEEEFGSLQHPGKISHMRVAEQLCEMIVNLGLAEDLRL